MSSDNELQSRGFRHELRLICQRGLQVWRLVSPKQKLALGAASLVMALTSGANTAIPLLLGKVVDQVKQGTEQSQATGAVYRTALLYLGLIGVVHLVRESLQVLRRYLVENTCTRIEKDATVGLVSHLLQVDLATFSREKVGALHGRMLRSVSGLVRFLRLSFLDFFPAVLSGLFALLAVLSKQPWLALMMAGVIPVGLGLVVGQLLSQKGIRIQLLRSKEGLDGTVVEQLNGIDYIRAANTSSREVGRVERAAEAVRAKEIRHHFAMSLFGCAKALNEGLFHVLVLGFAIYLATTGRISVGDILTFSMLFLSVMSPLAEVHRALDEAHESSLLVGDLMKMMSEPIDRSFQEKATGQPCLEGDDPIIAMEDLHVEYGNGDGKSRRVLDGVSVSIRHGETIGVAGRSGAGKSTWLRVLMRLTHPTGGRVILGGVPLECVSREAIGSLVGYVGQSPFVFSGTIAENIAYGSDKATTEDVQRAAQMACLHDEILEMPAGYQHAVAEGGKNLSGGQKQRLALARIFLRNPPILILDEGTSALDNISERYVQRAVAAARAERTVILVAHRLSTLRDADRILVFDGGRIAERGTYDALIRRGGVFTELVRSAADDYEANGKVKPGAKLAHTAVS